jgi:hypothetical protein
MDASSEETSIEDEETLTIFWTAHCGHDLTEPKTNSQKMGDQVPCDQLAAG